MHLASRYTTWAMVASLVLPLAIAHTTRAQNVSNYATLPDPLLFLLREPAIQAELKLSAKQARDLTAWNEQHDGELLASRNKPDEKVQARVQEILTQSHAFVAKQFTENQRTRLQQITYRLRGIRFVLLPTAAEALELTTEQRSEIESIVADSTKAQEALQMQLREAKLSAAEAERRLTESGKEEQEKIFRLLTEAQQRQVASLVGPPFNVRQLGRVSFKAPEIATSDTWINSDPLTLAEMRGKVVAVHFWAFGCSNCIANYPWYRDWERTFADRELVILGVHTPETSTEREVPRVREKVAEAEFGFPVVVDNDLATWNAWGNSMWPSVYLVDKRGRLRYWWYGELNWQGAGGQTTMAQRIEELLAEPE